MFIDSVYIEIVLAFPEKEKKNGINMQQLLGILWLCV